MANYSVLKAAVAEVIRQNGNNEITGPILQQTLLSIITSLGANYQFAGVATPSTNPGTPDQNVFYIASEAGTYSNFSGIVVAENEVAILKWNGTWAKETTGVATAAQLNQLGQKVDVFPISENLSVRQIFKELYVPSSVALYSQINKIRVFKAYYVDSSQKYRSGVVLLNGNTQLVSATIEFTTEASALAYCKNEVLLNHGIYFLIDWDRVTQGESNTYSSVVMTRVINDVDFMPAISEYIDNATNRDDIVSLQSSVETLQGSVVVKNDISYRTGVNLANPANITQDTNVNNSGQYKTNVSGWATILIPVVAGKTYTFGRCALGRQVNGAFYQGENNSLLKITYNDTDMVNGKTITAPANADRLYLTIQTPEISPNYSQFTFVEGGYLLPYSPYELFVEKVLNKKIWAANSDSSGAADLSTLIVDLPVSDGTDISSGYAYIDSTDRSVKVKQ